MYAMNNTALSQPDTQASGAPASWQTIFWTLVPLAISSMTQPGGRICGLPSRYRTYLRCSPILCCADGLSIALQLGVLCLYQKQRLLEAVGMLLHERFSPSDNSQGQQANSQVLAPNDDEEAEGVQSLEKMTWLRWLWFILGTLPPSIKLLAMTGVRWQQAWGMMFLSSWTINEALIIFAAMNQSFFTFSPNGQISWPGFEHTTLSSRYQQVRLTVAKCQRWLAFAAISCHCVVLNGAFRVVFRSWQTRTVPSSEDSSFTYVVPYSYAVSIGPVMLLTLGMMGGLALLFLCMRLFQRPFTINTLFILPLITTWLMLTSLATNSPTYFLSVDGYHSGHSTLSGQYVYGRSTRSAQYVYIGSTLSALAFLYLVQFLGRRFIMLGRNLLVTYPDAREGAPKIDHGAVLSLIFLLATILACGLWYGYVYDPSGTSNPSWTGVFG